MIAKLRRIILVVVGGLLITATLLVAFNAEVRGEVLLILAPRYFREVQFLRLTNGTGQEVYLLGTIHTDHLTVQDYSLLNLQAALKHLQPDLLLVESRPEELARDNWGDGPIEMPFASLTARAAGIEVQGMDWWVKTSITAAGSDSDEREDHMFQNILVNLARHRETLILTGWSHVEGFRQRFLASGYRQAAFSSAEKQALFDTSDQMLVFPAGMAHTIEKRIELDRLALQDETDSFWRSQLANAIEVRQEYLKTILTVGEQQP